MTDQVTEQTEDVETEDVEQDTEQTEEEPETAVESVESVETEPDTFPRSYVEELRQENGKYRQRAQRADDLAARLHTALVAATGRLADPTDLSFAEEHLDDADALTAAIDDLLAAKPHLASRKVRGDVGQGASRTEPTVDLAGILRSRA